MRRWLAAGAAVVAAAAAIAAVAVWDSGSGEPGRERSAATETEPGMTGMEMGGEEASGAEASGAAKAIAELPETPVVGVTQMNGLAMPPGMIVTRDTSMEAMREMAAVDLTKITYTAPASAQGDRLLKPRLVGGVKEFRLQTAPIRWSILPDVQVAAYAFNLQVPGPRIRVTEGDRVRVVVTNHLPEATSVHWHGLAPANGMDGAADVTQKPIPPGESFTYEFVADQPGTFFYHSHRSPDRQQALGLYGALIVDPKAPPADRGYDREVVVQVQEWKLEEGYTFPAMPQEGAMPNYFTLNGKAFPASEPVVVRRGERILFRFIGSSTGFTHPMHVHGGSFTVVGSDGNVVPESARIAKDTISVAPGERWDVVWTARKTGTWLVHCHVTHHITNEDVEEQGGGGLTLAIKVV